VIAYKFLTVDGTGIFSRFRWPFGEWVEAGVDPCRSGVHGCRPRDLPYWVGPELYEVELDGAIVDHMLKVVAPRGRLTRRIDAWNGETREAYSQMCIARASELAAASPLLDWAPPAAASAGGPALMGFIAARIAEETGGVEAYVAERERQAAWLTENLQLASDA
jgi:hypothetical protein